MKVTRLLTAGAVAIALVSPQIMADPAKGQDKSLPQKKQMEQVIHDYLVNNPEVLLEVSQALQKKQQQAMQQQAQTAIKGNANQLFNDSLATVGNPKGKVTLVEFFDYQCIHCKKMSPILADLLKKDKNLKIVYKEFPIFGKSSDLASKVALAAAMQGKYQAMHDALIRQEKRLNTKMIMDAAKSVGLDLEKLKTDMESQTVKDALEANRQLAEKLHLMGTPAFIVAPTPAGKWQEKNKPTFIPGAASEQTLRDLIKKASPSE